MRSHPRPGYPERRNAITSSHSSTITTHSKMYITVIRYPHAILDNLQACTRARGSPPLSLRRRSPRSLLARLPLVQPNDNLCPVRRNRRARLPQRVDLNDTRGDTRESWARRWRPVARRGDARERRGAAVVRGRCGDSHEARGLDLRGRRLLLALLLFLLLGLAL